MKITEYKGEDAVDLLADIMEPAMEIFADSEVFKLYEDGRVTIKDIKHLLKTHKKAVIEIMARVDGIPYEEYVKKVNIFTLPKKALELLSDKELMDFFASQGLNLGNALFGSVMENIEETETE